LSRDGRVLAFNPQHRAAPSSRAAGAAESCCVCRGVEAIGVHIVDEQRFEENVRVFEFVQPYRERPFVVLAASAGRILLV
jgi:hypothetical protein